MRAMAAGLCSLAMAGSCFAQGGLLLDNGPCVTLPGGGFNGRDLSAVQTVLGLDIAGFAHAVSTGTRVADDFTVEHHWNLMRFTFFAYQTGAAEGEATCTQVNIRVWDNPPGEPGAQVIWGDSSTDRLTRSTFAGWYRAPDTDPLSPLRAVFRNDCDVEFSLPPGTYWLDWQTAGKLNSGPWCPPVTIAGELAKPGANARQFANGGWKGAQDAGKPPFDQPVIQDLPFEIYGEKVILCFADCDKNQELDVDDYICFQTLFGLGDIAADCDGSGELDIDDFICFQTAFAAGCP